MKIEMVFSHDTHRWRISNPSGYYRECPNDVASIGQTVHEVLRDYAVFLRGCVPKGEEGRIDVV